MKIATHRLEFLLFKGKHANRNEHAPYTSFIKREAGMKIATYQYIDFPLQETHEPK